MAGRPDGAGGVDGVGGVAGVDGGLVVDEVPDDEEQAAQSSAITAAAPTSAFADRVRAGPRSGAGGRTSGERVVMARLLPHLLARRRVGFRPGDDSIPIGAASFPNTPSVAGTLGLVRLAPGGIT